MWAGALRTARKTAKGQKGSEDVEIHDGLCPEVTRHTGQESGNKPICYFRYF